MKPAQIPSAILWSGLALVAAAAPASATPITILMATLDSTSTNLTINGQGFSAGDHVFLANTDITAQCSFGSATRITCTFGPPAFPSGLPAGEYRVNVSHNANGGG